MRKKNNILKFRSPKPSPNLSGVSRVAQQPQIKKSKIEEEAVQSILKVLSQKDHYTFHHSLRVAYYSIVTGREIGLSAEELYELELSALFHDIGKIDTPDAILKKPFRLSEDEFEIMKKHPDHSYDIILKKFPFLKHIAMNSRLHHERFDGKGYPLGLKGGEIPFSSRVILIADTFDAMTSTRPYRKGLPFEVAYAELLEFSGTQFDPFIVEHFINALKKEEKNNKADFYIPILGTSFSKSAA